MRAESYRRHTVGLPHQGITRRIPREATFIYLSLLPVYAITILVSVIPLVYAAYISLHEWVITRSASPGAWVGIANFVRVFQSPEAAQVFGNTAFLAAMVVCISSLLGLGAALILNADFIGRGVLRGLLLLPWAIPGVAAGIMWWWMFNSSFGIINYLLRESGILGKPVAWLVDHAMWTVILASIWKEMPLVALLFLGRLQTVDPELHEAAFVDGATTMQDFWYITLPLLRNVAAVVLIFQTATAIKTFDLIFALTYGGPAGATTTLAVWTYVMSFRYWNFGLGSAIAFTTAALIMLVSVVYLRTIYRRSEAEA